MSARSSGDSTDHTTQAYYRDNAADLVGTYETATPTYLSHLKTLLPTLPNRTDSPRVLDVGCGTCRDIARLRSEGFEAYGVDPSEELLAAGRAHYELPSATTAVDTLPDLVNASNLLPDGDAFDAVLCAAVLQQIPEAQLLDSLYRLASLVKPGGILMISIPTVYPVGSDGRDAKGRIVYLRPAEQYRFFLERLGLKLTVQYESSDGLGRDTITWCTLVFSRGHSESGLQPVETIESILWDDRKVNTYKFALVRALADLAAHRPKIARWVNRDQVAIPVDFIIDLWIEYYWPLVGYASDSRIMQGHSGAKNDMAFRPSLTELAGHWSDRNGGYAAFRVARASDRLDAASLTILKEVRRKTRSAIQQPVRYAGNDRTGKKLFEYDDGSVLVPATLWRELALMSRWIVDSVVLRWAEFSLGFRQPQGVDLGAMIGLLLTEHGDTRDTRLAREAYATLQHAGSLRCVWTGATLSAFDVDHVIPWALWRNNDLWNLVPADPKVNNQKRDRVPRRDRVIDRKPAITEAWDVLFETEPVMFTMHARNFVGQSAPKAYGNDLREALFTTFKDALEFTASTRGAERW